VAADSALIPTGGAGLRPWLRKTLTLFGIALLVMLSTVLAGGLPVVLLVPGALVTIGMVMAPLAGMSLMVISQIIWLLGAYAPAGIGLLAASKIFTGLTALAWIVAALRQRIALTWAPHMLPLAAFGAVTLLAAVLTPAFEDGLIGVGKYAMMFAPYLLVANLAITPRGVRVGAAAVSAAATLSALLAVVERFLPGIDLTFGQGISLGAHVDAGSIDGVQIVRVTGGIGDANWFSYTMATALPLCLYWYNSAQTVWLRLAAVAMALLQLGGVVLSYTRTPLIGLAGALLYFVWKRKLPLGPLLLVGALGLVTSPWWVPQGLVDRFFSEKYLREGSTPMRREIFSMALQLIAQRPVLGHGYQQFGPQFIEQSTTEMGAEWERRDEDGSEPARLLRAHNLYLDVWVMHGAIGLLPLVLFYLLLLREMAQVAKHATPQHAELALALSACLLSFYLCGLGGHAQELKIFWVLAGLAAGLRRLVHADLRGGP
jgi:O-antigen ligase